jgi:hypothetical protein
LLAELIVLAASASGVANAQKAKPKPKPALAPAKPPVAKPIPVANNADTVPVTVVEVAGGNVYLKPGAAGGVRRNSKVTIDRREYFVTASTTSFAIIELGDTPAPREQATGVASVVTKEEEHPKELPPPHALEELRGQWTAWHPPAESQHPKPVPLGLPDHDRRYDVLVWGYVGGLAALGDRGGGYLRAEIGLRMHVEPFSAPLMLDVDGSAQRWFGAGIYDRDGARPTLRVRELQLGYGNPGRYFGAMGRIKYAAATLGALDGIRARAPIGQDFSVSAFGGVLPDPLDGEPSTASQRFGAEVAFSKPEVGLRPEAAVVVHGSTYDGRADERRISGVVGIYPGRSRVGAHVEVSAFDKDNPWGVNTTELTAAGLDAMVRVGVLQLGAHADMRQQERSRFLASFLPPSWFCVRVPGPPPAPTTPPNPPNPPNPDQCDPRATTLYQAGVDAGLTTDHFALFLAGLASDNLARSSAPSQAGVLANMRVLRIYRGLRLEASGTASTGTFMDIFSGGGGPGISAFGDRFDASIYYRRTIMQYRVGDVLTGNAIGAYATLLSGHDVVVSLQGEGTNGDDLRAVMGAVVVVWRPRL